MLRKKGCTTSSQMLKSSNDGIKFPPILPCVKFSTTFASTPKESMFAHMKHVIAAASMNAPPKPAAPCPTEKNANMIAPKIRLAGYLKGYVSAEKKSPTPKPSVEMRFWTWVSVLAFSTSASDLHIAPQNGQILTVGLYEFGHAL